jgi:hypothetical protein
LGKRQAASDISGKQGAFEGLRVMDSLLSILRTKVAWVHTNAEMSLSRRKGELSSRTRFLQKKPGF